MQLFSSLGYELIDDLDATLEAGYLKIALYGDDDGYTHAARQLPDGRWTSKIGKLQDIDHDSLEALTSLIDQLGTRDDRAYGKVARIMKRPWRGAAT